MSEPIGVNDLVMVVRPTKCGCARKGIGRPFVVERIMVLDYRYVCDCGESRAGQVNALGAGMDTGYAVERLIRIDPPATDETTETPAELTA